MAYKKTFKKRATKKVAWYKKKYNAQDLALKALKQIKYIKGLVNSETYTYYIDQSTPYAVPNTNTMWHINAVPQGDTEQTRTGLSLLGRSVTIQGRAYRNTSADFSVIRLILFVDTQQVNSTPPTLSDVLATDIISSPYLAPMNMKFKNRFKILDSQKYHFSDQTPVHNISLYANFQYHCQYTLTTGASVSKNGIYLLAVSNEATNKPSIAFSSKFSYHDN